MSFLEQIHSTEAAQYWLVIFLHSFTLTANTLIFCYALLHSAMLSCNGHTLCYTLQYVKHSHALSLTAVGEVSSSRFQRFQALAALIHDSIYLTIPKWIKLSSKLRKLYCETKKALYLTSKLKLPRTKLYKRSEDFFKPLPLSPDI